MSALRVTTWNVLHRVHGLNWKEPAVARFSDERAPAGADELGSEQDTRVRVGYHLDETIGLQHRTCAAIGREREFADFVFDASLLEFFLRLAD